MIKTFSFIAGICLILSFSCENSTSSTRVQIAASKSEDGLVGDWEQQFTSHDKNSNNQLDAEERNSKAPKLGYNWFRFQPDGSCLYDKQVKFKGVYEVVEKNKKKILNIRNKEGQYIAHYNIAELNKDELVLKHDGAFMVFKRTN